MLLVFVRIIYVYVSAPVPRNRKLLLNDGKAHQTTAAFNYIDARVRLLRGKSLQLYTRNRRRFYKFVVHISVIIFLTVP